MAAPDYKARFADAQALLNYGYASCRLYEDQEMPKLPLMAVTDGIEDFVPLSYQGEFSYLSLNGEDFSQVEKKLMLPDAMEAPVEEGEKAGVLR